MVKKGTSASARGSTKSSGPGRRVGSAHSGHNRVDLKGQVTGEPKLRTFESGAVLITFNLRVPGRTGRFTSVPVCVWDADAATAGVSDGDVIRVRGALVRRFWADHAGGRRSVVEVVADDLAPTGGPRPGRGQD